MQVLIYIRKNALAGSEQIIPDHEAEYDDNDGKEAVCNKEHNGHTYAEPEQDKTDQSFHMTSPLFVSCKETDITFYAKREKPFL